MGSIRYSALLLGFAIAMPACASAPPAGGAVAAGDTNAAILAEDLHLRISLLASDSLRGRDTGSPGIDIAADYLAREAARLGLRPAGDGGSYFQNVPLRRTATRASVSGTNATGPFTLTPNDILPVSGIGGLPGASKFAGGGPIVFGGHLVDAPLGANEINPEELRDAVVIVRLSPPPGVDPGIQPPRLPMATLFSPMSPAAAVLLVAEETEADFWEYAADVSAKGAVGLDRPNTSGPTAPPFFLVSVEAAERLLGATLAESRYPRTDLGNLQYSIEEEVQTIPGRNVIAILPGRDPARAGEYIVLGAHYDHVGVGAPLDGDSIYNGADDNASGTAVLAEVAEAFANLPMSRRPARSVVFAWFTAEEAGLLGSEFLTDQPPVPRDSIIAHINMDMVGRNSPDSLFSVGSRRLSTEFGDLVEAVNQRQERPFVFDFEYDEPGHPEQIYCRSDHYNFARFGIPILFLTTGMHPQYHAPSDEIALIDSDKAARVATLVRDIVLEVSDRPSRPRVDQPVPPLGAPCF